MTQLVTWQIGTRRYRTLPFVAIVGAISLRLFSSLFSLLSALAALLVLSLSLALYVTTKTPMVEIPKSTKHKTTLNIKKSPPALTGSTKPSAAIGRIGAGSGK